MERLHEIDEYYYSHLPCGPKKYYENCKIELKEVTTTVARKAELYQHTSWLRRYFKLKGKLKLKKKH